jgi:hypothetical protein
MGGKKHGAMSKVNRKQTSGFVRTSNSPKNDIKQSLLYLYGKTNCTKISNYFFSSRIHPCPQFFCLKGFRLVLYVREKKRAQIISFFFFFLSIDVCCQTSYRITPPLCHSDDFNQLFFSVHLSAVRAARVCLLSWPPYFSTAIIIIYIRRPIFPVQTFLPGTSPGI